MIIIETKQGQVLVNEAATVAVEYLYGEDEDKVRVLLATSEVIYHDVLRMEYVSKELRRIWEPAEEDDESTRIYPDTQPQCQMPGQHKGGKEDGV